MLFFINFLNVYNGKINSKLVRDGFINYLDKILTPTGYLSIGVNNHVSQPVYILKIDDTKRFKTIYKTPIEIYPNPWFDKFNDIHYECNINNYMGRKYIS